LKQVGYAYDELVDYLVFQYLLGDADVAPPRLPVIGAPVIPDEQKPDQCAIPGRPEMNSDIDEFLEPGFDAWRAGVEYSESRPGAELPEW
jgi:hypothetical protein